MEYNYKALLKKARDEMPEKVIHQERFEIPKAEVLYEGKSTVLRNFADIADTINREQEHFFAYLLRELGTAGTIDGRRGIFKGNISTRLINERIKDYVETFVLCSECGRPDTHLEREARTLVLRCDACGAFRPVTVRKVTKQEVLALEEGKEYDVVIVDISRRGDGIARKDKYTIFVPGVIKGAKVKIRIEKISGNVAFGKVVSD